MSNLYENILNRTESEKQQFLETFHNKLTERDYIVGTILDKEHNNKFTPYLVAIIRNLLAQWKEEDFSWDKLFSASTNAKNNLALQEQTNFTPYLDVNIKHPKSATNKDAILSDQIPEIITIPGNQPEIPSDQSCKQKITRVKTRVNKHTENPTYQTSPMEDIKHHSPISRDNKDNQLSIESNDMDIDMYPVLKVQPQSKVTPPPHILQNTPQIKSNEKVPKIGLKVTIDPMLIDPWHNSSCNTKINESHKESQITPMSIDMEKLTLKDPNNNQPSSSVLDSLVTADAKDRKYGFSSNTFSKLDVYVPPHIRTKVTKQGTGASVHAHSPRIARQTYDAIIHSSEITGFTIGEKL
jgi:hypothetical protein